MAGCSTPPVNIVWPYMAVVHNLNSAATKRSVSQWHVCFIPTTSHDVAPPCSTPLTATCLTGLPACEACPPTSVYFTLQPFTAPATTTQRALLLPDSKQPERLLLAAEDGAQVACRPPPPCTPSLTSMLSFRFGCFQSTFRQIYLVHLYMMLVQTPANI